MSRIFLLLLFAFTCTTARSPHAETKTAFPGESSVAGDLQWLFNAFKRSDEDPPKPTVCDSEECELIAQIMKASMNESVDPCDDFYEYACGMWRENPMIRDSPVPYSLWAFVARDLENRTEGLLDKDPAPGDALHVKLAKHFYKTCMDVDGIEKAGLEPFLTTISRIGGWPLIMEPDEWSEQDYSWQKVDDYYARLEGRNAFYRVDADMINQDKMEFVAVIETPVLPTDAWVLEEDDESEEEDDEDDSEENEIPPSEEVPADSVDPDSEETVPNRHSDDEEDDESDENEIDDGNMESDSEEPNDNDNDDDNNIGNNSEDSDDEENECTKSEHDESEGDRRKKNRKHKKVKLTSVDRKKRNKHKKVKKVNSNRGKDDSEGKKRKKVAHKRTRTTAGMKHKNIRIKTKSKAIRTIKHASKHMKNIMKPKRVKIHPALGFAEKKRRIREAYAGFITEAALAMSEARGDKISRKNLEKDVEDLVQFIVDVLNIVSLPELSPKNMTIDEWQEVYDDLASKESNAHINWYEKLSSLFNEANVEIESDMLIMLNAEDYLKKLASLLDRTPSRTIVNYIHWNFLSRMLFASTQKMRALYLHWSNVGDERKAETSEDREESCSDLIDKTDIIGYEFVRKYFNENTRKTASDMVEHIQAAVKAEVEKSEWLDDWGKNFVLEKLQNMKKIVGFPDWYQNKTAVNKHFSGLVIGPTFFENVLSYSRYQSWRDLRIISTQKMDIGSVVNPLMLNAFYVPQFNTLAVTAADLQSPLFGARRPRTVNYGIIGAVLGHEVNHGFDGEGRKYDKSGKVTQWLSAMVQEYSKRAECFVEQYDNYANQLEPSGIFKGYGNMTRDENIADTMGLEACYNALKIAEKEAGVPESTLPGFEDFNTDQMFFLSYANLWCGTSDSKSLSFWALFDEHSTGPLRVRGSLSNMKNFGKAFNCPVGSTMNPEKKCNIWN